MIIYSRKVKKTEKKLNKNTFRSTLYPFSGIIRIRLVISKGKILVTLIHFYVLKCLGRRYYPTYKMSYKWKEIACGQIPMISNRMMQKIKNSNQAGNNHPVDKNVLLLRCHRSFLQMSFHTTLQFSNIVSSHLQGRAQQPHFPPPSQHLCLWRSRKYLTLGFLFFGSPINFFLLLTGFFIVLNHRSQT